MRARRATARKTAVLCAGTALETVVVTHRQKSSICRTQLIVPFILVTHNGERVSAQVHHFRIARPPAIVSRCELIVSVVSGRVPSVAGRVTHAPATARLGKVNTQDICPAATTRSKHIGFQVLLEPFSKAKNDLLLRNRIVSLFEIGKPLLSQSQDNRENHSGCDTK